MAGFAPDTGGQPATDSKVQSGVAGGTVTLTGMKRLLTVSVFANGTDCTAVFTQSDDKSTFTVTVRKNVGWAWSPGATQRIDQIVFSASADYFVENV